MKDATGDPGANGTYAGKFEIFNSVGPGGGCLWQENQQVTTQGGLFSAVLGTTVGIPDSAFNDSTRWLAITVGNDPEMAPRQRLVSVGYSYRVGTVDGATGGIIHGNTSIQSDLTVAGGINGKNMTLGTVTPGPPQVTPFLVKGAPGQSANLMDIQDDAGASLVSFGPSSSYFKHFTLFGHSVECSESLKVDNAVNIAGNFQTSGISEVAGQDITISLATQHLAPVGIGTAPSPAIALRVQSGTMIHELGHNLSLRHNGAGPPPPASDDFLQAVDESGNKVASIDSSGGISCAVLKVGGALSTGVTVVSSPTESITLNASHSIVLCNAVFGSITVHLPPAATAGGRQYTIKLIFSNFGTVIIDPFGSEMIEGASTYSFSQQYKYVTIVSDGSNWWIIANN